MSNPRKSTYASLIQEHLTKLGKTFDPRHIEAYMRCEHHTLDGLSPQLFKSEVNIAVAQLEQDGTDMGEVLALSFGL